MRGQARHVLLRHREYATVKLHQPPLSEERLQVVVSGGSIDLPVDDWPTLRDEIDDMVRVPGFDVSSNVDEPVSRVVKKAPPVRKKKVAERGKK